MACESDWINCYFISVSVLLLWISASSTSDFWTLNTSFIWTKGEVMLKYYATINKPHTHTLSSMWYIHQAKQHLHLVLLKALTRLSFIKQSLRGSCNKNTWIDLSACLPACLVSHTILLVPRIFCVFLSGSQHGMLVDSKCCVLEAGVLVMQ